MRDNQTEQEMQDLREQLESVVTSVHGMKTSLDEVHAAVIGNPKIGHRGLVTRVEDHDKRITTFENRLLIYSASAAGGAGVIVFILKLAKIL